MAKFMVTRGVKNAFFIAIFFPYSEAPAKAVVVDDDVFFDAVGCFVVKQMIPSTYR